MRRLPRGCAATLVAITAVVSAISLARTPPRGGLQFSSSLGGVPISSSLQPIAWPPPHALDTTSGQPLLFSTTASTGIGRLPCLRTWLNLSHLARRDISVSAWTQPRRAAQAEFTLARGREAEFTASQSVRSRDLTLEAFWARATDASAELVYHSAPVTSWGDASLAAEVEGALDLLAIADAPSDVSAAEWPSSSGPIAWMGSAGVVATPHYDKSLNLVLQVTGRKRWLLWPPEEIDRGALCMHPSAHPSRRQVRTPLLDAPAAARAASPAIEATIQPGQILYVPPFWTHAVEALTPALSLSVLSPSWTEAVGARLTWPGLPFGRVAAAPAERAAAVAWYLRALLPIASPLMGTAPAPSVRDFAHHLHAARYAHPSDGQAAAAVEAGLEAPNRDDGDATWRGAACVALRQEVWPSAGGSLPTHAELMAAAQQVAEHAATSEASDATRGRARRLPAAVVRTLLSDYIESIAVWAVGERDVGALLRELGECRALAGEVAKSKE